MAVGLAIIHWHAGIDGMDIEFVLGRADGWNDEQVETAGIETDEPFLDPLAGDLALDIKSSANIHQLPMLAARNSTSSTSAKHPCSRSTALMSLCDA
jgi:hypothetical protein